MSEPTTGAARTGGAVRVAVLVLGVVLLAVGGALLAAGPTLYRMKMLDLPAATLGLQQAAMYTMVAAAVAGLIGLLLALAGKKHRAAIVGVLLIMAAGVGAGSLYSQVVLRGDLPPIYDVQTDWGQPVAFTEAALRVRDEFNAVRVRDDAVVPEGEGKWSGMTFAEAQSKFYDDLKPLTVRAGAPEATVAATEAAKRLGWDVMLTDPPGGMMEAVHHSTWYDLAADIAVRVVPEGAGARIDVRSTSRDAGPDMGANADRVKQLIDEIALELR